MREWLSNKKQTTKPKEVQTMMYITNNNLNEFMAGSSWEENKHFKKTARKIIKSGMRITYTALIDFIYIHHDNEGFSMNVCCNMWSATNYSYGKKVANDYVRICKLMGVNARRTEFWDNNGHPALRWAH